MFYDVFVLNNFKCKVVIVGKDVFFYVIEWVVMVFRLLCDMCVLYFLMKVLFGDFYF